jgi:hypothetical protein
MRKFLLATFAAAAISAPAFATDLTLDTLLGTSMDEVKTSLTEMGYEVRKAEMEDGQIEVYFVGDNTMGEVYVSPQTGKPIKIAMK